MQVKLGASVVSSDEQEIGAVDRLVIDPVTRILLNIIVRKGRWATQDRIIDRQHIDYVGLNGVVMLSLSAAEIDKLPEFVTTNFITPQANWDSVVFPGGGSLAGLGVSSSFAATSSVVQAAGPGGGVSDLPGDFVGAGAYGQVNFEEWTNLPSEALLIDRGADVVDKDEKKLGEVDDFVYDEAGAITGFRVRGGLFGRKHLSLPVSAVAGAAPQRIRLNIPGAAAANVPPPAEAPSRLAVLAFPTLGEAEGMLEHVRSMEARGLLLLDDAVIATAAPNGSVELTQTRSDTGRFALRGAGGGVLAGLLLGGPIGGLVAGAALGAITGAVRDAGLDDDFIRGLGSRLQPGQAALFLLVRRADFARVLTDLRTYNAEVLHADLSPDRLEKLRAALSEG